MKAKQKLEMILRVSENLNDYSYTNVNFRINDLKENLEYYIKVIEKEKKYNNKYKDRFFVKSTKRLEAENDIISDLLFLDKFAKQNDLEMLYGNFTKYEFYDKRYLIENNYKRKDILIKAVEIYNEL